MWQASQRDLYLSTNETNEVLRRWAGHWKVLPISPMSIKGPNANFYIKYKYEEAYINGDSIVLYGGTHQETQVSHTKGSVGYSLS